MPRHRRGHHSSPGDRFRAGTRRIRLLRPAAWSVLVAIVLATVAGGQSPDGSTSARDRTATSGEPHLPASSEPTAGPTAAPTAATGSADDGVPTGDIVPAPTPSVAARATVTDLEALALRGSDLPAGWRILPDATGLTGAALGSCLGEVRDPETAPTTLEIVLQRGSDGPLVAGTVAEFPTERAARRAFRAFRGSIAGCGLRQGPARDSAGIPAVDDGLATDVLLRRADPVPGRLVAVRVGARHATALALGSSRVDLDVAAVALRAMARRLG